MAPALPVFPSCFSSALVKINHIYTKKAEEYFSRLEFRAISPPVALRSPIRQPAGLRKKRMLIKQYPKQLQQPTSSMFAETPPTPGAHYVNRRLKHLETGERAGTIPP
jgi:hypothetical protein